MTQLPSTLSPEDRARFTGNLRRHVVRMARVARTIADALELARVEMQHGEEFSRPTLRRMYRSAKLLDWLEGDGVEGTSRRDDLLIYSALLLGQLVVDEDGGWVSPSEVQVRPAVLAQAVQIAHEAAENERRDLQEKARGIGERMRQAGVARALTQAQLAEESGVPLEDVARMERGEINLDELRLLLREGQNGREPFADK